MPSDAWARLLRIIPEKEHDSLMLLTASRTEIAIQSILRIDPDFLIIKGRLAGSQDAGRVFFIPYEQLDYIGFNRAVKDAEFNEMFAELDAAPEPPEAAADEAGAPALAPSTMKSAVLERFRARATSITRSPLTRPTSASSPSLPSPDEKAD